MDEPQVLAVLPVSVIEGREEFIDLLGVQLNIRFSDTLPEDEMVLVDHNGKQVRFKIVETE